MNIKKTTTAKEALIAEMLGDMDTILARIEAIPALVDEAEAKIKGTAAALDDAGDKYRLALTAFTEQAKAEILEHTERLTARTVEDQKAAMQEAARLAFRSEASDKAAALGIALSNASKDFRRSLLSRLIEHAITAVFASGLTGGVIYIMLHKSL